MGIFNLKKTNFALLCIWIWRYHNEPNGLWRQIIKAKYDGSSERQSLGSISTKGKFSSLKSPWMPIIKGLQWFEEAHCTWNEIKAFLSVPQHGKGSSTPAWNLNEDKCFYVASIKVVYLETLQNSRYQGSNQIFEILWSSPIAKKCKFFSCTMIHKKLNTVDYLQKKLPNSCLSPNMCVLCNSNNEDMNHIILNCKTAVTLWDKLILANLGFPINKGQYWFSMFHFMQVQAKQQKECNQIYSDCISSLVFVEREKQPNLQRREKLHHQPLEKYYKLDRDLVK